MSGATGYFGSLLVEYFRKYDYEVYSVGRNEDSDIAFDLKYPEKFNNKTIGFSAEVFIHCAASNEINCKKDPYNSLSYNVLGTKAALDFCVYNRIPKFIYVSTFHVFGVPDGRIDENSVPAPSNEYGISHYLAEKYVEMYDRKKYIEGIVLRPTNIYGCPSDLDLFRRWTLVPFSFCKEAIETGKIELKTSGAQQRNFVSGFDVCKVIELLLRSSSGCKLLHIYGPQTISILDFALMVCRLLRESYQFESEVRLPDKAIDIREECVNKFEFGSDFLSKIYIPTDTIESHIKILCSKLLEKEY